MRGFAGVRPLGLAGALVATCCGTLLAGGGTDDPARALEAGRELYRIHCRACHGDDGRGNGPAAEGMETRPADLTRLAAGNGGRFPSGRVRSTIDGRDDVALHRRRAMPRWGFAFQELDTDVNQESQVRRRIEQLIRYLESIQDGPEDGDTGQAPRGYPRPGRASG